MAKIGSSYLTEDVIFEILSWLPVLSLLRCRAVCKLWHSIISNPRFVEAHLANSQKKQASILRVSTFVRYKENTTDSYEDVAFIDTRDDSVRLDLPPRFVNINDYIRSCNGLVCLSNYRGEVIHLWNPATKLFKKLPTPEIQERCFDLGFYYDSVSKDYKLLRIVPSNIFHKRDFAPVLEAELYSTSTDSWKKIQVPETVKCFRPNPQSHCVLSKTGVLYMEGLDEMLSFDLHTEAIRVYPFHGFIKQLKRSNLLDFNGNVAIISKSISDLSVLSVWTLLDDRSGKLSWTKVFNVESDLRLDWISLYLGSGEFMAENNDFGYIFYDSKKKETTMFPIQADICNGAPFVKYTESLVSLNGFKQLE